MAEVFQPARSAALRSLVIAVSPALVAAIMVALVGPHMRLFGWAASVVSAIVTVYLVIQTASVFASRIVVDERGIAMIGPLGRTAIAWAEVGQAVLRERVNALTRTDHMLVLTGGRNKLICHPSTLSRQDEDRLLTHVRSHVTLIVQRDKPSI